MTYLPDFTITIEGAEPVPLLFNFWTYKQYCLRKGLDMPDLQKKLAESYAPRDGELDANGKPKDPEFRPPFPFIEMDDVLLLAHETYCKSNKLPFAATEFDAAGWLQETGCALSELYSKVYALFIMKFFNKTEKEVQVDVKKETKPAKKKEAEALSAV